MRRFLLPAVLSTLFGLAGSAHADFTIPGFELVQTAPLETTLSNSDLRNPVAVWSELFDSAKKEIVIAQFYVVGKPGSAFDQVLASLTAAGQRGVKIRFLLDQKGVGLSEAPTIAQLKAIPNLELRIIDYSKLTGNGIVHAKYLVVDGQAAYVGSQNFDWRSFSHIHETGLKITEPAMVSQVQAIFDQDWQAQAVSAQGARVTPLNGKVVAADYAQKDFLLASPNAYNPPGVGDSETGLPALLAEARNEVRIQLLDYAPLSYGPNRTRPYYAVIDNALRAAANRGVRIKLMVSNWNTEAPALAYLKSLAILPNVEIRIVTIPTASTGFIPFARVIHSKTMSIDGKLAWVGTSNWSGGYFDLSRNLEVVMRNEKMAQRLAALHQQAWDSAYAQPLDINKDYPKPAKASPQ
ncbi:phospholipase D-like domain-containing protein [Janthinobacterium agaricidamnosum]|uniref:Phospholipase D Active site motif family protein n=1 Tax=Janthinobacterium agaricidamnosum NBRC 102515 = DSM 9628 TaxID=1349767 RepID=W0VBP4_9BURK|nr:phospholipase D-like domain-containing protein [Janthinobacterium agaricidamnosum]CDG85035.1 phospholipase D Active site motif family protein [Janthinobacterium agaricidamnosum NBRC 102515 = DSM 9628]